MLFCRSKIDIFFAEYEAFKKEILHLKNILQNQWILFFPRLVLLYCGLFHSAILHLKNDSSFCKNNPTQKPQPYREHS